MAAFSLRGYWRTLMERMAWSPAMMITRFTPIASSVAMILRLLLGRLGLELRLRRQGLVQGHRHPVAQLEGPGAHHPLPRREARQHLDEVAPPLAEPDELLLGHGDRRLPG